MEYIHPVYQKFSLEDIFLLNKRKIMIIIKKALLKLIKSQSEEIPFKIFIFIYSFISLLYLIVFVAIYKFF